MSKNKIRPSRIIKGWTGVVKGTKEDFAKERMDVCNTCPAKKAGVCTICGCPLIAKTKVIEEHCPENKWTDVKYFEDAGMSLVNLSTDKGVLLLNEDGFSFIFNELTEGEDSEITLKVVNESEKNLKDITIKSSCGCTMASNYKSSLKNEDDFDFNISYDTERLGAFSKRLKFKANGELMFLIKISGTVNRDNG